MATKFKKLIKKIKNIILTMRKQCQALLISRIHPIYLIKMVLPTRKSRMIAGGVAILILIPIVINTLLSLRNVEAGWWNDNWLFRQKVTLTNDSTPRTDYQAAIVLDTSALITAGKMNADCSDIRLYDLTNTTLQTYAVLDCNTTETVIGVIVTMAADEAIDYYLYYGNSGAQSTESAKTSVFEYYDDFTGTVIDGGAYAYGGGGTVEQNDEIRIINDGNGWDEYFTSTNTFARDVGKTFQARVKTATNVLSMMGWHDSGTGVSYTDLVYAIYFKNGAFDAYEDGLDRVGVGSFTGNVWYDIKLDLKATGVTFYQKTDSGTSWTTIYDSSYSSETPLKLGIAQYDLDDYTYTDDWIVYNGGSSPVTDSLATEESVEGPVAYWKFDEGYNQNDITHDSTKYANHGTLVNSPTWLSGSSCIAGACLQFDGTNDHVVVNDSASLDVMAQNSLTISGWFKHTAASGIQVLLAKYETTGADGGYKLYMNSQGRIVFAIDDDNTWGPDDSVNSPTSYTDNVWHHVSAIKTGTASIKLYIDGVKVAEDSSITVSNTLVNDDSLYIGIDGDGTSYPWKGALDEFKVYLYARTDDEIKNDYNQNSAVRFGNDQLTFLENNLALHWDFDESTANTCDTTNDACDSSGNLNHGVWFANAFYSASGKFAGAVTLDGTTDHVATNSSTLVPGSWTYQQPISIAYSGSALSEYQVLVENLDTASLISAGKMQSDCDDLRFTDSQNNLLSYSIIGNSCNSATTQIWVKTKQITGNTTIYAHYGNQSASVGQSEVDTFSYNSERTVGYVLSDRMSSLSVISLENGNIISHNGSTVVLNEMDTSSFTGTNYAPITAKKLFTADTSTDGTNIIVPVSWAGTEFILRNLTGTEEYFTVSPWGTATVRLYSDGVEETGCGSPFTVTSAGLSIACPIVDNVTVRITSDIPILVAREGNLNAAIPLYPTTSDSLYGISSSNVYVAAGPNGADYRYISSSAASETNPADLAANSGVTFAGGGAGYYSGDANMVYSTSASNPISAVTYSDADGSNATSFVRKLEFGTKFGSAIQTDYVAVVGNISGTTCSTYNDNTLLDTATLSSSNTMVYELPNTTDFGRSNSTAYSSGKWKLECNKPVYAFYQTITTEEKNGWTYPMMRQYTYPEPTVANPGSESASTYNRNPLSIAAWVNADTLGAANRVILARGNSDAYSWAVYNDSANPGKLKYTTDDGVTIGTSVATLSTGAWYHIAVVANATNTSLYINGEFDSQVTHNGTLGGAGDISAGADPDGSDAWDGMIDEVRIYSLALGGREIRALYNWAPGPAGWWKLDEGSWMGNCSTTDVADSSGNGHNGTACITGDAPSVVTGRFGNAAYFDGTTNYINAGAGFNYTTSFSYSYWVALDDYDSCGPEGNSQHLLGTHHNAKPGGNGRGWGTYWDCDGIAWELTNSSGTAIQSYGYYQPSPFPVNESWHHIAFVYDSTTPKATLYWDGVEAYFETVNVPTTLYNNGEPLTINGLPYAAPGIDGGPGKMDDIRVYNYIRTPAQIIQDMNAGHPAPGSPVGSALGHWKFDEGYGDTSYDSGTGGNNGNLAGSDTCPGDANCPTWTNNGKFGKALSLDASDDYLSFPGLNWTPTAFTVAFWIYPQDGWSWGSHVNATNDWGSYMFQTGDSGSVYVGTDLINRFTPTELPANTLSQNIWQHVVFTFNNGTGTFYKNGVNKASKTGMSLPNAWGGFDIGYVDSTPDPFGGRIDEIKIYNLALTADQVKLEYNQGASTIFGSTSTDSTGTGTWSDTNAYCPPGQGTACVGPIGEWNFDEKTDQYTNDTSGNSNRGTLGTGATADSSDPQWMSAASCHSGACLSFDGTNKHVVIPDNDDFTVSTTNKFTVEGWFKPNVLNTTQYVVTKTDSGEYEWNLFVDSSGKFTVVVYNTTAAGYLGGNYATALPTTNTWYHLAFTTDIDNNVLNGYLNGVLVLTDNTTSGTLASNGAADLQIGENGHGAGDVNGVVDEVKIYNYVRTPAQIAWDYNQGGPVGWYKFDEGSGTDAYNSALNGNGDAAGMNGTISNASYSTSGKFNQALDFNGTTSYISTTNANAIDLDIGLNKGLTITAWIKPDSDGESDVGRIFTKNADTWCRIDSELGGKTDLQCSLNLTTDATKNASSTITIGSWNHIAMSWSDDEDDEITLWVNGKIVGTSADGVGPIPATSDSANLIIGNDSTGATATFDGLIDDFNIFNYELTSKQMEALVNEGSALRFGP